LSDKANVPAGFDPNSLRKEYITANPVPFVFKENNDPSPELAAPNRVLDTSINPLCGLPPSRPPNSCKILRPCAVIPRGVAARIRTIARRGTLKCFLMSMEA
jgi:hypothetical protein